MALLYLFIGLLIQGSLIVCEEDIVKAEELIQDIQNETPAHVDEIMNAADVDPALTDDFFKTFFGGNSYSSPSMLMMKQVTDSQKSPEEQLKDIKEVANTICTMMQSEMANLMSFALNCVNQSEVKNELREKRSTETPIDSTKFLMRLLKHIKNNNEYQNIAIDKMMSAQEIADKFGIEFTPDTEVLTDLATAANKQTEELADILRDACDPKNETVEFSFVPLQEDSKVSVENVTDGTYYVYSVQNPEQEQVITQHNVLPVQRYQPEQINRLSANHFNHHDPHQHHHHVETQIVPPPVNQQPHPHRPQQAYAMPPVSPRPNFYEPPMYYTSMPEYYPQFCAEFEPISAAIILPVEEIVEVEPELVGEEMEETVTSRTSIDYEEPGTATVNHVMTYTVSEKAHFRAPQTAQIPQQMQYAFFLM